MNLSNTLLKTIMVIGVTFLNPFTESAHAVELTGTVSLPNDASASEDIRGSVRISNFDANDRQITSRLLTVTISAGSNSTAYSLDFVPAPAGGSYQVYFTCSRNCNNYLPDIYLQDDGTVSQNRNIVDADSFSSTVDFELISSGQLVGDILLSNNARARANMEVTLRIITFDKNGDSVADTSSTIFINNGSSFGHYSQVYQLAPADGSYQVTVVCEINCGNYLTSPLFLQDDGSSAFTMNTIDGALPPNADFELIEDGNFTGTISLPNNATAAADIDVRVQLLTYGANGQFLTSKTTVVTIPTGSTSTPYFISYEPLPTEVSYEVNMFCFNNCDIYLRSRQYLQNDGSVELGRNVIDAAPPLTLSVDFELIETAPLTGVVSLPNGANALADILIRLSVGVFDENDNFVTGVNTDVTINSGSSSAPYSLAYAPLQDGEHYQVVLQCDVNCGSYVKSPLYLQDDGSIALSTNSIDTVLPPTVDFELIEGRQLSGSVSLPGGITTASNIFITVTVVTYNESGHALADGGFNARIKINSGDSSAPYSLSYVAASAAGNYEVYANCVLGCGAYTSLRLHLQDNGSIAGGLNLIDEASMPTELEFELIGFSTIANLSVDTPSYSAGISLGEVARIQVQHTGGYLSCNTFGSDFNTELGLYGSDGALLAENDDSGAGSQSEITITDLESGTYFLAAAGHDSRFLTQFEVSAPDSTNGNLVVNCLLSDAHEDDNDETTDNVINDVVNQTHSIHQAGDTDWLTFSIDAQSNITISAQSAVTTDGAPLITVYDSLLTEVVVSTEVNMSLSRVALRQLDPGTYYIELKGFSSTSTNASYILHFEGQKIDDVCFPIITKSDKLAVICL